MRDIEDIIADNYDTIRDECAIRGVEYSPEYKDITDIPTQKEL